MTAEDYIQWLETQILKSNELGGMDREVWAFRQCIKKAIELKSIPAERLDLKDFGEWLISEKYCLENDMNDLVEEYKNSKHEAQNP